jgi:hypothetical protein
VCVSTCGAAAAWGWKEVTARTRKTDPPAKPNLLRCSDQVAGSILRELLRLNSEYANYVPAGKQLPLVTLCPAGDPQWFPVGVKHKYTL